ncbi:guanine nucleotide exchange factor for Rab-3A-like isoform X2 [Tachypleus tridentatus]|uniref:guanine nucleotide exchange factor for Rab-3A-like isoform X2 n=1 Tax=Tachypleus tridentatus TaxID=6853 RepID=UPI003FD37E48
MSETNNTKEVVFTNGESKFKTLNLSKEKADICFDPKLIPLVNQSYASKSQNDNVLNKSSSFVELKSDSFSADSKTNMERNSLQTTGTKKSGMWRSSSDGSTKIIPESWSVDKINLTTSEKNVSRRHSESDGRAEALKAKIDNKFEQLQQELQSKAKQHEILSSKTKTSEVQEGIGGTDCFLSQERPQDIPIPGDNSKNSDVTNSEEQVCHCHRNWRSRSVSVAEVKEHAYGRLREELRKAQENVFGEIHHKRVIQTLEHELKLKDEEVARLSQIRDEVGAELEELTASLFEEAHNMVREANMKHATSLKLLKEANLKNEVLQAEVQALKTLVITSTPSMPNHHLHPQLNSKNNGVKSFLRTGHKRSPSNYELASQKESPPNSPVKETPPVDSGVENLEIDPICHEEFVNWRKNPLLLKTHPFLVRVYEEDIWPCLRFANEQLAKEVLRSIEDNSIVIEDVNGKNPFPKNCCLLETPRFCKYRMKLGEGTQWYYISQLCRNRIAAVCEFFCYLRYIKQGLVKSGIHEAYWEVMRRRHLMAMTRLGLAGP